VTIYPPEVVRLTKYMHLQGNTPAEIRRELYRICGISVSPTAICSWISGAR
jgi:hypothetical protein